MKFSIVIPTFNNLEYLKLCIKSIRKNSLFDHDIIIHNNGDEEPDKSYLEKNKCIYSKTNYNAGICEGVNKGAEKASTNYIVYAHDDFYFLPGWDIAWKKEIEKLNHNLFYLSGTMVQNGQVNFNCGENISDFDEDKLLKNNDKIKYFDFQGSTWAPHIVHKETWNKVGGFSEEFFPGSGSDPDFNMKLWKIGVRIFKGLNDFKVYHFGSVVLRKKINKIIKGNKYGSKGSKIFLLKWGISIKFFKKFYLLSDTEYKAPLREPNKKLLYYVKLFICKLNYIYLRIFYSKLKIKSNSQ